MLRHGAPFIIHTDNGTEFDKPNNHTIIQKLTKMTTNFTSSWDLYLLQGMFGTNITADRPTGFSAFVIFYGRTPMLPHLLFDPNQYDTKFAADTELHGSCRKNVTKQSTSSQDKLATPFLYVQKMATRFNRNVPSEPNSS